MTKIVSILFVLIRLCLLFTFIRQRHWLVYIVAASEALALYATILGLWKNQYERRAVGIIVPLAYCTPLLFRAADSGSRMILLMLLCVGLLQVLMRFYMGLSVNVGVPMYRCLLDKGPYSVVRHPLALTEFLMAILFAAVWPTAWNQGVMILTLIATVAAVLIEESFLLRISPDYCWYTRRVPWRLIPYVL